jgi:hypothetical protein
MKKGIAISGIDSAHSLRVYGMQIVHIINGIDNWHKFAKIIEYVGVRQGTPHSYRFLCTDDMLYHPKPNGRHQYILNKNFM